MLRPSDNAKPVEADGGVPSAADVRVALISIGHCPSLAIRNLRRYCLAHADVCGRAEFVLFDRDLREFLRSRIKSTQRYSFATCIDEILASLFEFRPTIVAFSCYLWNTEISIHLADRIKRLLPETQIVLGGPDVGARASVLLEQHPPVDIIVDGDGEVPMLELLRWHLAGKAQRLATVPQVTYREGGAVVQSLAPVTAPDLSMLRGVYDELPTAAELSRWAWPNLLYETMRGCPYKCSFCMYGKIPSNQKDVATVVEELSTILGRGLAVELIDPTFTTYARRAREILGGLAERVYDGRIWFEAYPDSINEEMVELFRRARVSCVELGFQTLSSEGLKAVARPQNLERFERAVRALRAAGLRFYVDIIYGLPCTTADDFVATMDYLYEHGVDEILVYRLLGLPGSPMMRDVDTYGLVFSSMPPYELLRSQSFSLDDILFCERFTNTYYELRERMGDDMLRRFARMAGSLSAIVRAVMESEAPQHDDGAQLTRVLAGLMRGDAGEMASSRAGASRLASAM